IASEEETLATCRAIPDACSPAAHRLLQLVELGRQRAGRALLREINRAVNLSIRATSDLSQYGADDFWSAPLATIEKGAGDCEDYAILKYLALREAGISPDDLRLLIVSYPRRRTIHAVLAVHLDEQLATARQPDHGDGEQLRSNTISASDCIGLPRHYDICRM